MAMCGAHSISEITKDMISQFWYPPYNSWLFVSPMGQEYSKPLLALFTKPYYTELIYG
jgi:hypothetical protein